MRDPRRTTGVAFVCSCLLVAACATYTAPDGTGRAFDAGNAGDGQSGTENDDMGGEAGSQSSSGAGSAMNAAGGGQGGMGGAATAGTGGTATGGSATGGQSRGGSGGASLGGSASGGGRGGAPAGAAGTSATGGSGTGAAGGGALGGSGGGGTAGAGGSGGGTVNLISNFGFETNTAGWSVFGGSATVATSTTEAHSGKRSLLITGRTQTYQGPQYAVLDVVTPGDSYSLSLWGKLATGNSTGSLIATFRYTCSGGTNDGDNFVQWVGATAASASTWTRLTSVKTFPSCTGGTMTAAWLYVESPTATLSYYIDDVVLTAQ